MSDLINKYTQQHNEFIELLVTYYSIHEKFVERQSPQRTADLRKVYKKMRIALRNMEDTAQLRMRERSIERRSVNRSQKEEEK